MNTTLSTMSIALDTISTMVPPLTTTTAMRSFMGPGGHPFVRARPKPQAVMPDRDEWATPPQEVIPYDAWITFQVLHTTLTIIALIANCTSLGVIYGIVSKLTPPLQMLTSLAFADMLAPWAIMTMYFPSSSCQDEIHTALLITSHNAAAFTLIVLAIVHNIATFRPLNYDKIVTQKRLWIVINIIWITAILSAHIHFLTVLTHHDPSLHFCIQVLHHTKLALTMAAALLATMVLVTGLIYTRILLHLRPIGIFAEPHDHQPRKSTRGVMTGIILMITFVISWLPYLITKFFNVQPGYIRHQGILIGLSVCQIFILLNTISDPILYGCRMCNMQTGYLTLYHKCRGWIVVTWHRCSGKGRHDELPSTPLNPIESIC